MLPHPFQLCNSFIEPLGMRKVFKRVITQIQQLLNFLGDSGVHPIQCCFGSLCDSFNNLINIEHEFLAMTNDVHLHIHLPFTSSTVNRRFYYITLSLKTI